MDNLTKQLLHRPEPTKQELRAKLVAITHWLEYNHPEVFREGLWDAVLAAEENPDTDMVCEDHPDMPWPHGDCPGPGMPWSMLLAGKGGRG